MRQYLSWICLCINGIGGVLLVAFPVFLDFVAIVCMYIHPRFNVGACPAFSVSGHAT
jgi:hypothetical protein